MIVIIFGSGSGAKIVGRLVDTVVVFGRSAGGAVVVVVVGKGAGSTGLESIGVELLVGTLVEGLSGEIVVVDAFNRGTVAGRLTGTVTRIGPATTDLIYSLDILTLPSGFLYTSII